MNRQHKLIKMKRKRMISKIGKHSNFFAKRKLNYLWPLKLTVYFLLTLSTIFVPILVNSVFIDTKHTLRYDGEVNIGKLISIIFRTKLLYFNNYTVFLYMKIILLYLQHNMLQLILHHSSEIFMFFGFYLSICSIIKTPGSILQLR